MKQHNVIAIDLAKNRFQVCSLTAHHKITFNKTVRRKDLVKFIAKQPPTHVVMEACYSSHYWARRFQQLGHQVTLLPAQHVAPFVRGNKSDRNDALAIAEASRRPNITPVPIKSEEQQAIQSIHRLRERHSSHRTGLINQTRGVLSEYGIVAPQGHKAFVALLTQTTSPDCTEVPALLKQQLAAVAQEYAWHTQHISELTQTLSRIATTHPWCCLLLTLPGIGPINATALVSAIGDGSQFNSARDFVVWLGLTPRQFSSGGSFHSAGITKRGNRYLRKQLVHGARSVVSRSNNKTDRLSRWANQLVVRRGKHKATVAMAARIARLAWTLLQKQEPYQARY